MPLPACKVPTHSDWKKLRDKAGGKSGLSKVNMGKKLDEFHAALKADDVTKAKSAAIILKGAVKAYAQEVAGKYASLARAVNAEVLGKLSDFEDAMDGFAKGAVPKATNIDAAAKNVEDVEKAMKEGLAAILQGTAKVLVEIKPMGTDAAALYQKIKNESGVSTDERNAARQKVVALRQRLNQLAEEGNKLRAVGARIEKHDERVRDKFKKEYEAAVNQLQAQESTLKGIRTVLDNADKP